MHLKQLHYAVEIAKCQSFSKAAKKLFIAQPTLSASIAALEDELGLSIFCRTVQGITVTEEGQDFLEKAEKILSEVDQLMTNSDRNERPYKATLAAIPAACNALTISLLKNLSQTYPQITLNILEVRPQKILSYLINGFTDFGIGSYTTATQSQIFLEAQKNKFIIEPLCTDVLYAFLPRGHAKAFHSSITLKELSKERQAIFNDFLLIEDDNTDFSQEDEFSECYTFSDRSSIKQAIAAGLAYAILPHQMVLDDIYVTSGLIKAIPIADNNAQLTTYLAYRKNKYQSKQALIILDQIRELYQTVTERLKKLSIPSEHTLETTITRY